MTVDEVQKLLQANLVDCEVIVDTDGHTYQVTVVGDVFDGLMTVKRQQTVYKAFGDAISSGAVHAVAIKTFSLKEWETEKQFRAKED